MRYAKETFRSNGFMCKRKIHESILRCGGMHLVFAHSTDK
jgi:hypothetical protein